MKAITGLGDHGMVWIILVILLLLFEKTRFVGLASAFSLIITFLVVNVSIKNVVARTRPYEVIEGLERIIEAQSDFSFPSGHTAHAFAVSVVLFLMLPKKWGIPALIFAFVMGFTRLYVGVHYLSDVIAAAAIGTLLAIFSVFLARKIENKIGTKDELSDNIEN